jgi:hypothetical protein
MTSDVYFYRPATTGVWAVLAPWSIFDTPSNPAAVSRSIHLVVIFLAAARLPVLV